MTSGGHIQLFIEHTRQIATAQGDIQLALQSMQQWREAFATALKQNTFDLTGWSTQAKIANQLKQFNHKLTTHVSNWDTEWHTFSAAQSVAEVFHDRVMLLVFGKFNAGKSSLCNLLAECFRSHGQTVQYFHVQNEQIFYTESRLREGATETTAQLQGVCLGEKLILLDTPGLHSGTQENAALTLKFIDSADGVLWLSSATSPGQVQELDALGRELKRHKPLFPVITRSDFVEEDEIDGELCAVLCNKNSEQRALQESDVLMRAQEKLHSMQVDVSLLKPPVSVSTQMAREADMTPQAMNEAGFERLFAALLALIEPALRYKQRKPAEVLLHFLQEHIIEGLRFYLQPDLEHIQQDLKQAQDDLRQLHTDLAEAIWRSVLPELPQLLEQHANTQDIDAVVNSLNEWINVAFEQQVAIQLDAYGLNLDSLSKIKKTEKMQYERIAGMLVHDGLYTTLTQQIQQAVKASTSELIEQCQAQLEQSIKHIQTLDETFIDYSAALGQLSQALRVE